MLGSNKKVKSVNSSKFDECLCTCILNLAERERECKNPSEIYHFFKSTNDPVWPLHLLSTICEYLYLSLFDCVKCTFSLTFRTNFVGARNNQISQGVQSCQSLLMFFFSNWLCRIFLFSFFLHLHLHLLRKYKQQGKRKKYSKLCRIVIRLNAMMFRMCVCLWLYLSITN